MNLNLSSADCLPKAAYLKCKPFKLESRMARTSARVVKNFQLMTTLPYQKNRRVNKMALQWLISCVLIVSSLARPAAALDFKLHDNNSKTLNAVLATGTIEWADADRLDKFLTRQLRKTNTAVYLNSPGGSLSGGIRLGEYFKHNRIKTVVEGRETCASACALAFLGGTDIHGNRWMSSTTTSQLGFHAFRNADGSRYEDSDNTQQIVGVVLKYGQLVGAPMGIFVRNFQTPSGKMYWFSTREALSLGIKVWDMKLNCFVGENNCKVAASN